MIQTCFKNRPKRLCCSILELWIRCSFPSLQTLSYVCSAMPTSRKHDGSLGVSGTCNARFFTITLIINYDLKKCTKVGNSWLKRLTYIITLNVNCRFLKTNFSSEFGAHQCNSSQLLEVIKLFSSGLLGSKKP